MWDWGTPFSAPRRKLSMRWPHCRTRFGSGEGVGLNYGPVGSHDKNDSIGACPRRCRRLRRPRFSGLETPSSEGNQRLGSQRGPAVSAGRAIEARNGPTRRRMRPAATSLECTLRSRLRFWRSSLLKRCWTPEKIQSQQSVERGAQPEEECTGLPLRASRLSK